MSILKFNELEDVNNKLFSDDDMLLLADDERRENKSRYWDEKTKFKWTITYFFGMMLVYCTRTSMSVCIASISAEMGWSKQISGMALSAFFFGYLSTNILGGYFADRHGGEKMIMYSATIWATLTIMLPYFAHSKTFLNSGTFAVLATRFLTGCSQGFFFPSFTSIISKHVAVADRGMVTGFAFSGCSIGTIATGFFGSILIDNIGWHIVFIVIGIFSLVWVSWLKHLYHATTATTKIKMSKKATTQKPVPWMLLASKPSFWALMVAYFCNGYAFYNLLSWTPVYFHDAFPKSKGWVFNVVPWFTSFLIQNFAGYYANNLLANGATVTYVRKLYAAILFLGSMVFSLLLITVESFQQALFVMSLTVGVCAFNTCSISLNPQDLLPDHAGAVFGLGNTLGALGGSIGVYSTGYILAQAGHWSSVFMINAVISLFAFVAFQCFGSGEPLQ